MDAEMITNPFMVLLKSLLLVFLLIPNGIKVRFITASPSTETYIKVNEKTPFKSIKPLGSKIGY